MKNLNKRNVKDKLSESSSVTVFRYKIEDLEKKMLQEHEAIKNEVAIPLGRDLANMQPNKPEPECAKDVYSGVISGAYSKMMMVAKKELQSEIESHHIVADREEANKKLEEMETELEKKQTDHRLKKQELEKFDAALKKKADRYKWVRLLLAFMMLVDILLSAGALAALGYPLFVSYIVASAIGVGLFFLAEKLPEIINLGSNTLQKRIIVLVVFITLFGVFYVLGMWRATTFTGRADYGGATQPIYFAVLNIFFTAIATLVAYFSGLSRKEKQTMDRFRILEEEATALKKEVDGLKERIATVRKQLKESELARTQIQIYAHDLQELIQRLYEESQKTFYSTNCIHRSDGKVPQFFGDDIPMLPSFYKGLSI